MILVEIRSEVKEASGPPHPVKDWQSAMIAFAFLIHEHNLPNEDEYKLVQVGSWDPKNGSRLSRSKKVGTMEEALAMVFPAPAEIKEGEVQL